MIFQRQTRHNAPEIEAAATWSEAPIEPIIRPDPEDTLDVQPLPAKDEPQLVMQARQDPAAFGVLYERYIDRIYAYIYHRVGNAQDTEDLTARTFYRALDKLDTYEDRGLPFSAWLFRIAHNLVANWHRDRGRRRFLSLDKLWSHSKDGDSPEEQLEEEEKSEALWAAINRLPKERRDLLLYKFSSRLSNIEIGEMMDKSESAIKSLYFRTLATLRKDLENKGWGAWMMHTEPVDVKETEDDSTV
ncbi:MAG: sigma-70 family RNA polymerase sigma factor [Chloroflexi bacterium]|nr:sigma-70 family RNA polymerase sigma factor [Chloroflexota bacterium]